MAELVLITDVRSADWQAKLGAIGEIVEGLADIDQSIRTILMTPKGTVPHQPDFGCDVWRFLDWPLDQARPQVIREVLDAIAEWEPRAELTAVALEPDPDEPTKILLQLARRRRGTEEAPGALVFEVAA